QLAQAQARPAGQASPTRIPAARIGDSGHDGGQGWPPSCSASRTSDVRSASQHVPSTRRSATHGGAECGYLLSQPRARCCGESGLEAGLMVLLAMSGCVPDPRCVTGPLCGPSVSLLLALTSMPRLLAFGARAVQGNGASAGGSGS